MKKLKFERKIGKKTKIKCLLFYAISRTYNDNLCMFTSYSRRFDFFGEGEHARLRKTKYDVLVIKWAFWFTLFTICQVANEWKTALGWIFFYDSSVFIRSTKSVPNIYEWVVCVSLDMFTCMHCIYGFGFSSSQYWPWYLDHGIKCFVWKQYKIILYTFSADYTRSQHYVFNIGAIRKCWNPSRQYHFIYIYLSNIIGVIGSDRIHTQCRPLPVAHHKCVNILFCRY